MHSEQPYTFTVGVKKYTAPAPGQPLPNVLRPWSGGKRTFRRWNNETGRDFAARINRSAADAEKVHAALLVVVPALQHAYCCVRRRHTRVLRAFCRPRLRPLPLRLSPMATQHPPLRLLASGRRVLAPVAASSSKQSPQSRSRLRTSLRQASAQPVTAALAARHRRVAFSCRPQPARRRRARRCCPLRRAQTRGRRARAGSAAGSARRLPLYTLRRCRRVPPPHAPHQPSGGSLGSCSCCALQAESAPMADFPALGSAPAPNLLASASSAATALSYTSPCTDPQPREAEPVVTRAATAAGHVQRTLTWEEREAALQPRGRIQQAVFLTEQQKRELKTALQRARRELNARLQVVFRDVMADLARYDLPLVQLLMAEFALQRCNFDRAGAMRTRFLEQYALSCHGGQPVLHRRGASEAARAAAHGRARGQACAHGRSAHRRVCCRRRDPRHCGGSRSPRRAVECTTATPAGWGSNYTHDMFA